MATAPQIVAVFNSNDDVVEMLRIALEMEDFVVVSLHVDEVRRRIVQAVKERRFNISTTPRPQLNR